jgi:tetratricopeptide (TPR) repeat protein
MAATETVPPSAPAPARLPRRARLADLVVLAGVVVIVAFPVAARMAADRLPRGAPPALAPLPAGLPHPPVRDLPVGLRDGDLRTAATRLLGERRATELLAIVRTGTSGAPEPSRYPYRFPRLERVLPARFAPAQVADATDLGAKLTLLAASRPKAVAPGVAAYAVLDRARAGGACDPALDVLLLVAADTYTQDARVADEGARARRACPGDPTPAWLLGQIQSELAVPEAGDPIKPAAAAATFAGLVRDFPGSAAAWSGEADALVRLALTTRSDRAWVARHRYEQALARYRRAARLAPGPEIDTGIARALAGLGRHREAADVEGRAVAHLPGVQLPLAQLVVYREGAHRWAAAARAAEALSRMPAPRPTALFPAPKGEDVRAEDAYGPISLGAHAAPLIVRLGRPTRPTGPTAGGGGPAGPTGPGGGGGGVTVSDLTFLPALRGSPETVFQPWCPGFARARDRLLTGHPVNPRGLIPADGFAPAPGSDEGCGAEDPDTLAGVARIEAGDVRAAAHPRFQDARQNLWRWAGEYGRAERAARGWAGRTDGFLALQRLGEIEFLRHRYDDAARDFAAAARRARARTGDPTRDEARALLERGAALLAGGRRDEGEDALRAADDMASRLFPISRNRETGERDGTLAAISYYARDQLADAAREARALPAAADGYAAAREWVRPLKRLDATFHPEQLENNSAIVDVALGHTAAAVAATRRALEVDPESPAFLMTAAYAAARAGQPADAVRLNRQALAADASAYPAANDLGVLLARLGDDEAAVAALRRSVGGAQDYALGWFNLGVVLGGMGPLHLLASQGALAQAFTLDPALRDRERKPTLDRTTYRSGLDVSRQLPPEWTFAASQKHAPAKTAGLVALLAAAFGLSRALQARGGRGLAERWLEQVDRGSSKLKWLKRVTHPAIAVVVTLAVLLWPLARDPGGGTSAALAGALGLVLLVGVALRGRAAALRREAQRPPQRTWAPGVVFGIGAAAAGLLWTPLPVLGEKASPRSHWAAPAALAVVAVPLVLATVWLDVPLTRSLAAATLIMAASLLTPVKPVDGGAIAAAGGTAAGIAGIGLAAVLVLGLA